MFRKLGFLLSSLLILVYASLGKEKEEAQDLYWLIIEEQIRELPLDKAVQIGEGKKILILFVNPDCPHCREEWRHLREHLDKLKIYAFVIPFKGWGENNLKKALYIVCSENSKKAFDDVLMGRLDNKDINPPRCEKLEYHLKAAEIVGLRAVPLNILPQEKRVVEGNNPLLLKYLGIENHRE